MKEWESSSFGSVRKELVRLRAELEKIRRSTLHTGPSRQERQLMSKISELLSREETMERQRLVLNGLRTVIEALLSSKPRRNRRRKLIELMP